MSINMSDVTHKKNEELYQCPVCNMHYRDKTVAAKCEAWCTEHKSCNLEIIAYAVENESGKQGS